MQARGSSSCGKPGLGMQSTPGACLLSTGPPSSILLACASSCDLPSPVELRPELWGRERGAGREGYTVSPGPGRL